MNIPDNAADAVAAFIASSTNRCRVVQHFALAERAELHRRRENR
jgi:hypothetical protein